MAGSAAAKCSNQADLRLAHNGPVNASELPKRPSATVMQLVCIQTVSLVSGGANCDPLSS